MRSKLARQRISSANGASGSDTYYFTSDYRSERWSSRLVATAEEDRLNSSRTANVLTRQRTETREWSVRCATLNLDIATSPKNSVCARLGRCANIFNWLKWEANESLHHDREQPQCDRSQA